MGKNGIGDAMTVPWHFSPAEDNSLKIDPVEELRSLRYDEKHHEDIMLSTGDEIVLDGFESDCAEIKLNLEPQDASRFGLKLFCSPDQEEETVITYDRQKQEFTIDFEKASLKEIEYDVGRHHPGGNAVPKANDSLHTTRQSNLEARCFLMIHSRDLELRNLPG